MIGPKGSLVRGCASAVATSSTSRAGMVYIGKFDCEYTHGLSIRD